MKHWRFQTRPRVSRSWLLTLSLVGGLIIGMWSLRSLPAIRSSTMPGSIGSVPLPQLGWSFTQTDDAAVQQSDLIDYIETYQQPRRLVQVDLAHHPKISQFTDIDSSASSYGKNACALVAAAAALAALARKRRRVNFICGGTIVCAVGREINGIERWSAIWN